MFTSIESSLKNVIQIRLALSPLQDIRKKTLYQEPPLQMQWNPRQVKQRNQAKRIDERESQV